MKITEDAERIIIDILHLKLIKIRDIKSNQSPFSYSSGKCGPIYVSLRDLVGHKKLMKSLAIKLAREIAEKMPQIDIIAGNATAGIVPAWLVSEYLELLVKKEIPFIYIRKESKGYGLKDRIVGVRDNLQIYCGKNALIVDEIVNFGSNVSRSAQALKNAGINVTHAACFLNYQNPKATENIGDIKLIDLFTLRDILGVAEKSKIFLEEDLKECYVFLDDPQGWEDKFIKNKL